MLFDGDIRPFRDVFMKYELLPCLSYPASGLGCSCVKLPTTPRYPKGEVPTKISNFKGDLAAMQALVQACFAIFKSQNRSILNIMFPVPSANLRNKPSAI